MQVTRWIGAALALAGATVVAAQNVANKPTQEQRAAARAQAFAQADADGNGALSPQEFETFKTLMSQLHKRAWFARVDANGDGQVTLDELQAARMNKHGCHGDKGPGS
jgi:hypothetical protein